MISLGYEQMQPNNWAGRACAAAPENAKVLIDLYGDRKMGKTASVSIAVCVSGVEPPDRPMAVQLAPPVLWGVGEAITTQMESLFRCPGQQLSQLSISCLAERLRVLLAVS